MLSLEDSTMLADFATAESIDPSPRKMIDQSRIIYTSRKFRRPTGGKNYGLPMLCDFGEARIGKTQESGPFVQPHIYRAPEVIFEMPWGSAIDIWNLAGLVSLARYSPFLAAALPSLLILGLDLGLVRGAASIRRYFRSQRWS